MKRKILILLALTCFYRTWAQSPFSSQADSLIQLGICQTMMTDFDSALATFKHVEKESPERMIGEFYQAATLQSMMMDYETDHWEDRFYALINEVIATCDTLLQAAPEDPWIYFYLGSAHSYLGLYQAKSGELVTGIRSAYKGIYYLREAVDKDSTLYDAYLGIGAYKYWSGKYYQYLRWLPFIRDERKQGIDMVRACVKNATFSNWVALNNLAWIEYDRGRYEESNRLFQKGLEAFPESRFFLWGAASCYFKMKDWQECAIQYEKLLASVRAEAFNNGYNEIECRVKLAKTYAELGEYERVQLHCDSVLSRDIDESVRKRLDDQYKDASKYKKLAHEKLGHEK